MNSSQTRYGIEALTNRLGRSGSSLLTVAVVCTVVLGTVSIPVAGGAPGTVDESRMAYVNGGTVHLVDADGDTTDTGVSAEMVGPPADIDDDGTVEVPSVDDQGRLMLVEPDGSVQELANGAASGNTAMKLGDYDDDGKTAVIYEGAGNSNSIYRVEPGGSPQRVADTDVKGVIGYGDFDGDGAKEVVYVGDSSRVWYVDDDGSLVDTGYSQVGDDRGLGAGPLRDFDGDGNKRVAVVDGSSNLALVDSSGDKELLTPDYENAEKAPIGAANLTGDGRLEVIYLNKDTENLYYGTLDGETEPFEDSSDNPIAADIGAGVSGGVTTLSDSTAPSVSLSEPADGETYGSENVSVNVSANESVSGWNYSVDGGDNRTFDPGTETTLSNLSDGEHTVTVYAEDEDGNIGTETSTFTVDTTAPTVSISEPADGQTYGSENVTLDVGADENVTGWNYSLDSGDNRTFDPGTETRLSNLSDGEHTVTVYAEDDGGNVGAENSTFVVDTSADTPDTDGDGIPDSEEGDGDVDGDGTPNDEDEDADGDGIPDSEEGTDDTDGDGTPDYKDGDSDGDGIPDAEEGAGDADDDGTPNYTDGDADGDGVPDSEEGTGDADDDGTPDYLDDETDGSAEEGDDPQENGDTDGDGIPDSEEGDGDVDGDGTPDYLDGDSDGDGIPDSEEGTDDTDGDGMPDYKDGDSDGDGIPDAEEGTGDADDDGTPNYTDGDADGDGIPDSEESTGDTDGDGTPDYLDGDSDGDGVPDSEEGTGDTDGDGVPDYLDEDTDGSADDDDGSSGGSDGSSDTDGTSDGTSGENGTDTEPPGNGTPNDENTDTDGDGIPDAEEGDGDLDGDGTPNAEDTDTDGDGIPDAEEGDGDVDDDGTPNFKDTDTDGDGVPDAEEGTDDTDGDGTPDYKDTDSDGDGIPDSVDALRLERNDQYTVIDASLSHNEVTPGEEIEVVVEVENTAEERGEFVLQVRNDGALEKTERFTLPANATTTVRVPYRVTEPGNHTIEANRIVAGTVQAEAVEEEESTGVLSGGGGALPVFVLLLLMGIVLTLVGLARHRDRSDS